MLQIFDLDPRERLIAQLLVSTGILSASTLREALEASSSSLFFSLGEILIGRGLVTLEALEMILLNYCGKLRLGELAVTRGILSEADLEHALAIQNGQDLRIGEIFVELHLASPQQIEMLLDFQARCRLDAVVV